MTHLSVNVNKIATLRNTRELEIPDIVQLSRIARPPDPWGGRAAVAWARRLSEDGGYGLEAERLVEVAAAIDGIYGRRAMAVTA